MSTCWQQPYMSAMTSILSGPLRRFLVPRQQEQQLVALLQLLEQQSGNSFSSSSSGGGGSAATEQHHQALAAIADVQLSLTSLEEVFLNIAKQVTVAG